MKASVTSSAQLAAALPLSDCAKDVLVASIAAARASSHAPSGAAFGEQTARAVLIDRVPAVGIAGFATQGSRRHPYAFVGQPLYGRYDFDGAARRGQPLHVPLCLIAASGAVATGRHLIVFAGIEGNERVSFEFIDVWLWRAHHVLPWLAARCTPDLAEVARTLLRDRFSLLGAILESIAGHEAGHASGGTVAQDASASDAAANDLTADAAASAAISDEALCCTIAYHAWNVARARSFASARQPVVEAATADADALAGSVLLTLLFPDRQRLSRASLRRTFAAAPGTFERRQPDHQMHAVRHACRLVRNLDASPGPTTVAPRPVQQALDAIARMVVE
jgi:hypothetical protein